MLLLVGNIQEDDLRQIERELGIIDKVEAKRKSVWKLAVKSTVETETLNAIKQAYTTEELDTLKESFAPAEGKKSKLQLAIEKGLGVLGAVIILDDNMQIFSTLNSLISSNGSLEEIREGGITIAAELIFQQYNQVDQI